MEDSKVWYESRTIWGGLVAILASCANLAGLEIGADEKGALVEMLATLAAAAGGLVAIYGRVRARSRVGR
ncbi:hypothetical protein [Ensifer soli]|uniref:hypothetical protein n=1 Tax=Ciceribacter sp. sgz301302 TaxID=3342379 RepID=UPI0035BB94C7